MKNKLKNSIWLFYFNSVSLNKNEMCLIKALLWVSHGQNIRVSKVKHGLPFLKVSGFVSRGQLGNVHFRSFWFQQEKYGEGWVKCVCADNDSETWQLWSAFGKGKSYFPPSLCVCGAKVHSFTLIASTWLHNSKREKWEDGKKREGLDEGEKSWMMSSIFQ